MTVRLTSMHGRRSVVRNRNFVVVIIRFSVAQASVTFRIQTKASNNVSVAESCRPLFSMTLETSGHTGSMYGAKVTLTLTNNV